MDGDVEPAGAGLVPPEEDELPEEVEPLEEVSLVELLGVDVSVVFFVEPSPDELSPDELSPAPFDEELREEDDERLSVL